MDRLRLSRLLRTAIAESDLDLGEKLRLRLILAVPFFRGAVLEHMESTLGDASAMADGEIIRIIIEMLPEILEFIKALIGLFG